jgi:5-formyltetrahydrofolate cyclo-ligase
MSQGPTRDGPDSDETGRNDRDALRKRLREQRRAIPAAQRIAAAETLAQRLLALPFAPQNGHVAGYWAMDGEIALHVWQMRLPTDTIYCLPILSDDDRLRFAPWRAGEDLVANRYGIPEPADTSGALPPASMAMIVLPLVGFDAHGHRLGMGGGWYDRSLAFRRTNAAAPPWCVGVGFEAQRLDALQTEPWDIAMDAICTDTDTHLPPASAA